MDEIDRFLSAKNFYEALGLDRKTFTNEQVDKAYKKFAMKFHPDKNKSPKATQAFMKLGEMKETLKSSSKRNIYDQTVFHSSYNIPKSETTNIFVTKPNKWNDDEGEFSYYDSNKPKRTKTKKRKNIFIPLSAILILLILFSFIANTEPFTNSITKESLSKIIRFSLEDENPYDFTVYFSKILQKQFYIPKEWEKEHIYASEDGSDWQTLTEQIRSYADEVYKDKLMSDCEKEKNSQMRSHPSCTLLQSIL